MVLEEQDCLLLIFLLYFDGYVFVLTAVKSLVNNGECALTKLLFDVKSLRVL